MFSGWSWWKALVALLQITAVASRWLAQQKTIDDERKRALIESLQIIAQSANVAFDIRMESEDMTGEELDKDLMS